MTLLVAVSLVPHIGMEQEEAVAVEMADAIVVAVVAGPGPVVAELVLGDVSVGWAEE